jgi:hypothetical protein
MDSILSSRKWRLFRFGKQIETSGLCMLSKNSCGKLPRYRQGYGGVQQQTKRIDQEVPPAIKDFFACIVAQRIK